VCNLDYEIGEPPASKTSPLTSDIAIKESDNTPKLYRRDSRDSYIWRIRNLPYPRNVYNISVENRFMVVRTTNKK
jgi:hypothetical protein